MKYLKNRANYLQIVKERRDIQLSERINLLLENQAGSGVMGNEIKWGDCLLGRWLFNTVRKAQIGANLVRMRPVISRLRGAMDDLLVAEQLNDLTEVDKAELNKALSSEYIDVLQQAIDDFPNADPNDLYYRLESIQNLTSDTIEKLEGTTATPYLGTGFQGKNEILRQLKKFKEEIDNWLEYEVPELQQQGNQNQQQQQQQINPQQAALNVYQRNFLVLLRLLLQIQKLNSLIGLQMQNSQIEKQKAQKEQEMNAAADPAKKQQLKQEVDKLEADSVKVENEILRVMNEGLQFIYETEDVDKKYQELLSAWQEEQKKAGNKNLEPGEGTKIRLRKQAESEVNKPKVQPNSTQNTQKPSVQPAAFLSKAVVFNIGKKLWSLISSVLGKQDTVKSLNDYINNFEVERSVKETNSQIRKIYDSIRKEKGLSNEVVKESIVDIFNDTEKIAAGIKALYEAVKSRKGQVSHIELGLQTDPKTGKLPEKVSKQYEEMKELFVKFYDTIEDCLVEDLYKSQVNTKEEGQEEKESQEQSQSEAQRESKLFNYQKFIIEKLKGIDKKQPDDPNDPNNPNRQHPMGDNRGKTIYTVGPYADTDDRPELANDLKNAWGKVFPNLSRFILTKQQAEQLKETLDKKLASQKDSIIILGMDPVLEIVKCFNRAYKIHTTQVIPSGRTGGEVTNKIFMEYTCFGSGSPANAGSGGGPYRNNKLFDLWESSVLDIMKDKQYQKIFNNATRLKVGDEYIEKAGANLRKFMNDMINGDELYGKEGQQAKFLDKYFGYKDGDDPKNTNFGGAEEREANMANTPEAMNIVLEEATKERDWNLNDLKYTFFALKAQEGGTSYTFIFFVQDIDINTNSLIVSYCQSAYHMKKILTSAAQSVKLGSEFAITEEKNGQEPYVIAATKIPIKDFLDKKGIAKQVSGRTVDFIMHEGCKDNPRLNSCNDWDSPITKERKSWSQLKFYNIIDKSKSEDGDRAKAPRIDKIDDIIKQDGGFLSNEIKKLVFDNNCRIQ